MSEARLNRAAATEATAAEPPVTDAAVPNASAAEAPVTNAAAPRASAAEAPVTNAAAPKTSAAEAAVTNAALPKTSAAEAAVTNAAVPNASAAEAPKTNAAPPTAAAAEAPVTNATLTAAAPSEAVASNVGVSASAANEPPRRAAVAEPPAAQRLSIPAIAAGTLAVLVVIGISWRLLHGHPNPAQPASSNAQSSSQPAAPPAAPARNLSTPTSASAVSAVLHQEIPDVPRHARESIRGRIKVTVRVTVDRSGNVVGQRLVNSGSSRYFARLASVAAGKWKFAPTDKPGSRAWLLQFEFTRGGVAGHAAAAPS